jgi:hypothetical protein
MKKLLTFTVMLMLCGILVTGGCSSKSEDAAVPYSPETTIDETVEPDYAGPIVEAALTSLCQGDRETHSSLFIEEGKNAMTEEIFRSGQEQITGRIGTYNNNKTFGKINEENGYLVAYYYAEFTEETVPVEVRAIFQEENGEMKLAGFWLNSPKLRGE